MTTNYKLFQGPH